MRNLCMKCNEQLAVKIFDHEALCESCAIDRLIETIETLKTAYISVDAEIRFEEVK
jgi:hypothetical protein